MKKYKDIFQIPTTDFTFKRIFGTERNKRFLIHFLNCFVSKYTGEIVDITYLPTNTTGMMIRSGGWCSTSCVWIAKVASSSSRCSAPSRPSMPTVRCSTCRGLSAKACVKAVPVTAFFRPIRSICWILN